MPWISPHWREACFHWPSLTETCVLGQKHNRGIISNRGIIFRTQVLPARDLPETWSTKKHKSRGMKERLGKHAFRNEYARKDAFLAFNFFSRKLKFYQFCLKKKLAMRSRLLGFGPGGYPSHAYFTPHA